MVPLEGRIMGRSALLILWIGTLPLTQCFLVNFAIAGDLPDDEYEYRFIHPEAEYQIRGSQKFERRPASEFGFARIHRETGQCRYEYWYDGMHSMPFMLYQGGQKTPDPKIGTSRAWLTSAAGFDGEHYWVAEFSRSEKDVAKGRTAYYVTLFRRSSDDPERCQRSRGNSACWFDHAILHRIANDLSVQTLVDTDLRSRLRNCPEAVPLDDGRHVLHKIPAWNERPIRRDLGKPIQRDLSKDVPFQFTLRLSEDGRGMKDCEAHHTGSGYSQWPLPVPPEFKIERVRLTKCVKDSEREDVDYSWTIYKGPQTKVFQEQ